MGILPFRRGLFIVKSNPVNTETKARFKRGTVHVPNFICAEPDTRRKEISSLLLKIGK